MNCKYQQKIVLPKRNCKSNNDKIEEKKMRSWSNSQVLQPVQYHSIRRISTHLLLTFQTVSSGIECAAVYYQVAENCRCLMQNVRKQIKCRKQRRRTLYERHEGVWEWKTQQNRAMQLRNWTSWPHKYIAIYLEYMHLWPSIRNFGRPSERFSMQSFVKICYYWFDWNSSIELIKSFAWKSTKNSVTTANASWKSSVYPISMVDDVHTMPITVLKPKMMPFLQQTLVI